VLIEFDPKRVSYDRLLETFWKLHDPWHRRGEATRGYQYRSVIFAYDDAQKRAAETSRDKLQGRRTTAVVATEIVMASTFWMAEDYHQQYQDKGGFAACRFR
jgi:peptide-methionine (S)-S-oxide reductase